MPIGFIFLGVCLIYVLFNIGGIQKIAYIAFLLFFMLGFFVLPISFDRVSINIIFFVSAVIVMVVGMFRLKSICIFESLILSVVVCFVYAIIASKNSEFVTSISQLPIMIIVFLANLLIVKNLKFVFVLNATSFILLSLTNLMVETNLGFINFASIDLCNALLIVTLFSVVINYIVVLIRVRRQVR